MHDLTTKKKPPNNLRALLGLNLKFIPRQRFTTNDTLESTNRLRKSVYIQDYYLTNPPAESYLPTDARDFDPKLHIPTHWRPPDWMVSKLTMERTNQFASKIDKLFTKRNSSPNLSTSQLVLLKQLRQKNEFLIAKADKNLGPCVIETEEYIKLAFRDHLNCKSTYERFSARSASNYMANVRKKINSFLYRHRNCFTKVAKKFIRVKTKECDDPFPQLYLLMKVHKTPMKTRPVVSCSGSLLQPLGI